ncbi:MAG: HAD-IA family hydrolase [Clostridiales bacterium]|nr:HAD-IA family hydrolase [Clostridiales bacterium]
MTTRKIILIGPMGSGKSTLAKAYADKYDQAVYDTDCEFTRRHGDINAYFEQNGGQAFRNIENGLLVEAANSSAKIIACGGGAVLDKVGMNALRRSGDIVYLTAPKSVLKERIDRSNRPLKAELDRVLSEREELYKSYADYTVNTDCADALSALEKALDVPRKNRYDVLLCDADDTVLDFQTAMKSSVVTAARAVGITKPDSEIILGYSEILKVIWEKLERREITRSELDIQRFELLKRALKEEFDTREMNEIYISEMQKTRFVIDGAIKFLSGVRARGIKVYIITNSFTKIAKERLKALYGVIDGAFISEEVGFDKPSVKYFERVHAEIGYPDKRRILVFGDSTTSDIAGGIAFGVDTCLYDRERQKQSAADFAVSSFNELDDII